MFLAYNYTRIHLAWLPAGTRFEPPGNVHAPYYPHKGPYSSSDPDTIRQHIQEMLACNVTVLVSRNSVKCTISFQKQLSLDLS